MRGKGTRTACCLPQADAEAPPFPPGSFNLIVERHVLWTLPNPEQALRAWSALLRPGGRLVLIEGDWDMAPRDEYADVHGRLPLFGGGRQTTLLTALSKAGFVRCELTPLMSPDLWGELPRFERYLLTACPT
jgi:SAM-dependent methyltransferase